MDPRLVGLERASVELAQGLLSPQHLIFAQSAIISASTSPLADYQGRKSPLPLWRAVHDKLRTARAADHVSLIWFHAALRDGLGGLKLPTVALASLLRLLLDSKLPVLAAEVWPLLTHTR